MCQSVSKNFALLYIILISNEPCENLLYFVWEVYDPFLIADQRNFKSNICKIVRKTELKSRSISF